MKAFKVLAILPLTLALLTSCSKDETSKPKPKLEAFNQGETHVLRVLNTEGAAVAGATVVVGTAVNAPFEGNQFVTAADGTFTVPADWNSAEMVTIQAPGYVRSTYLGQMPAGQSLTIRKQFSEPKYELSGKGTGFQVKDKDGLVDYALMIQPLGRKELFMFDLSMVISSEMDEIEVMGQQVLVPANISLPKQKESYILPVTIEKPRYHIPFYEAGEKTVYTIKGQFPFKKVIDEMRDNKKFFELINYFTLQGGSIKKVNITKTKEVVDLPVNELKFDQSRTVKVPNYNANEYIIALPGSQYQGQLYPTDVKRVESGATVKMTTAAGSEPLLLLVLKDSREAAVGTGSLSTALVPFTNGVAPTLLPIVGAPKITGLLKVEIPTLRKTVSVQEHGTFAVLSTVVVKQVGSFGYEIVTPQWDVYGHEWVSGFQLPELADNPRLNGTKRWEVSLIGGTETRNPVVLGPTVFEQATHASHSFLDF